MFGIINKEGDKMELSDIKGLGTVGITNLKKLGIESPKDLLEFYPFRYDFIKKSNINELKQDDKIIIDGVVESIPNIYFFNRKMDKMTFKINTGERLLTITIFNRRFLKDKIIIGRIITIIGKFDKMHNSIVANDIRFEKLGDELKIEPVYHTTYGISNKKIENYINNVINSNIEVKNEIPSYFMDKYKFIDKKEAIRYLHKPIDLKVLNRCILELKYEELFLFMSKMYYLKTRKKKENGIKRDIEYSVLDKFIKDLPFLLTADQEKTIYDIYEDMISNKIMNRLVQGDVGSGKTIVAFCTIYLNYLSGYQSAMMAPTEILAIQHYENINKIFKNYNINIRLITGKTKAAEKREIYSGLEDGSINIIIGTHALISENVKYNNLGLVITDEQHRFGVNQRGSLKSKGINPDILYLSATPIPRTYALTLYGDMDVSSIKTMPNGRKNIETYVKKTDNIKDVLMMMYGQLREDHQIYVVAPLIEENENSNMENINDLYDKMNRAFGKKYNIGMLHGKLKNSEKEKIMEDFKNKKIHILVATTVIEVGVDVKNATMMVIFDAYRFGLSTLHQLRGRVGRNDIQSYCILVSDKETKRLNILEKTNDGFEISEEDFLLRGSGDLFGIRQSGDMFFKLSNLKSDYKLLLKVKDDVEEFFKLPESIDFQNDINKYINLD